MRFLISFFVISLCGSVFITAGSRESDWHNWCRHSTGCSAEAGAALPAQYAPDRKADILHLAVDVTPDFRKRTVSGTARITFKPIAQPLRELVLDAVDLSIQEVTSPSSIQGYQANPEKLVITFDEAIPPGQESTVTIRYRAQPEKGLYFRTVEMGYGEGEDQLFTQGEAIEARHWYPSFDYPNEKFSTEITCRVPEGMIALSNGKLLSQEKDPESGLTAFRWLQEKPHVNYLVSLVAGYFEKIEDRYGDLTMAFYTPPSEIGEAKNSFKGTKEMMAFFEEEIGFPYPWAKYDQVVVRDFMFGGMENTSITTLTDRTLFTSASENIRSSKGLVAHELAHQWFGNVVTCKDWSQLWLNEGFATYYAHLYAAADEGPDSMLYGLYQTARHLLGRADDTRPIVSRRYDDPVHFFRQYGHLIYGKGSWVLHMLRSQLGPELFRDCVLSYLEKNQFESVVTEDLNAAFEEISGRNFDRFFDQWVFHGGYPQLNAQYSWDQKTKLAKISLQQTQKTGPDVFLFHFPLTIRFKTAEGNSDHQVFVTDKNHDFYFPLEKAPQLVRIDPEYTLLAKINLPLSREMLKPQLTDETDVIGRLLAVEQLSGRKDHETLEWLRERLQNDPFYGVRMEASRVLRAIHSDAALEALLASRDQNDARVRAQVFADLGDFFDPKSFQAALDALKSEKNPEITTRLLAGLKLYPQPEVRQVLLEYLEKHSYRNMLAEAAVEAIRSQADPSHLQPLLAVLKVKESDFTTRGFAHALECLAVLARDEPDKDSVLQFLSSHTKNKKERVQSAAISSLGMLRDPSALPLLETFNGEAKDSPRREAAQKAIAEIRSGRKPADEFKILRDEILELQKENRTLRGQVDDLRKQFEAWNQAGSQAKEKAKLSKPPPIKSGKR